MRGEEAGVLPVYVELEALVKAVRHCREGLPYEVIGFLIGERLRWRDKLYVLITDTVRGRSVQTRTYVEFDQDALAEVAGLIREEHPDAEIVGWYHSHPGYGCFMSPTDIRSHTTCFPYPHQVALVIDPVRGEASFFKVDGEGDYRTVPSAVVRRTRGQDR
ncbi:MAG: Mov34/MPN/PAD-1 family protein [Aigarchaeota archaeon]|nr:Mov34/MPN/PAD-1 family protein [Aigarchaeota archaeon]MCS7127264.1 Mov34/MPN/PAD-1 family protein [Candidatus Calditenuaceae archaeon]MDW8042719.1 Mov34/MPN/PAD-1 family protein [Nitrososphaerota archaeon]